MTEKVINVKHVKHASCRVNVFLGHHFAADSSYADWCMIVRTRKAMMAGGQAASKR